MSRHYVQGVGLCYRDEVPDPPGPWEEEPEEEYDSCRGCKHYPAMPDAICTFCDDWSDYIDEERLWMQLNDGFRD